MFSLATLTVFAFPILIVPLNILPPPLFFFQESAQESVITRDIHRTFPAHEYFKNTGGDGQESLYKICKVWQ